MGCRRLQQFKTLTRHKKKGQRWITKEQYIRYFTLASHVLNPDCERTDAETRDSLTVRHADIDVDLMYLLVLS